jgi:hypothetical protein
MESTLATNFEDFTCSEANCWKALKQLLLHVPAHYASDPPLKEQSWFPFQLLDY